MSTKQSLSLIRTALKVQETFVPRAAVPAIDAHNHLGRWLSSWVGRDGDWSIADVPALLALMEMVDVCAIVNLDGRWGAELEANLDRYDRAHPGRFATFCHAPWEELAARPAAAASDALVASLRASHAAGAKGLKVWKDLGLGVRDGDDRLVMPDDARLFDLFEAAGELGLPVLIHTADPVAFWWPVDEANERWDELGAHPEWAFGRPGLPSYDALIDALEALVAAHPRTTFIGAHMASAAEDLARVGRMLDDHPNLVVDVSARIAELGRQPRATRRLLERHPTRVLFGSDAFPPRREMYELHWRFAESDDEQFHYHWDPAEPWPSGRWRISGLDLAPELLEPFYAGNARRVLANAGI
ncbi:amidohydrolase family protein [Conexibacter sp. JD483]|uniref:amidohydrolase family protein n=1 Tax=unclassified Conexibacter TaxID=2627773 RepID=UPI00272630C9|nr:MULTISPECIES: amidohydrolase family protein [unclassified Conexibacter]MDO8184276.1 amidohydrolase family protein [Conexibacter sp. CPCC 205706]MDO8197582.1 amidohydrolase family protein [Conexibacter sp. CPCC 205762]MDR9371041.1 amidohydrolase family protein [Conexibacter sp. JD483]